MAKKTYVYSGSSWVEIGTASEISFPPTFWTPSLGGGFTIGNGTVSAKRTLIGKMMFCHVKIAIGSTTTIGNGLTSNVPTSPVSGVYGTGAARRYNRIYPLTVNYISDLSVITINYNTDPSSSIVYSELKYDTPTYADFEKYGTYEFANKVPGSLPVKVGEPFAFIAGDEITFSFSYEEA